jgi:hypothetical protein
MPERRALLSVRRKAHPPRSGRGPSGIAAGRAVSVVAVSSARFSVDTCACTYPVMFAAGLEESVRSLTRAVGAFVSTDWIPCRGRRLRNTTRSVRSVLRCLL